MKKYLLMMISLLVIFVLGACNSNTDNQDDNVNVDDPQAENMEIDNENNEDNEQDHPLNDDLIDNAGDSDVDMEDNQEGISDEQPEKPATDLLTETGIYNGQADSHTIEIETANGPTAFQLTEEAKEMIDVLMEGKEVTYKYIVDGDTKMIDFIEMNE